MLLLGIVIGLAAGITAAICACGYIAVEMYKGFINRL